MKNLFLLLLITLALSSCGSDSSKTKSPYSIETQIYAVKGSNTEFEKDSLQLVEIEFFNDADQLVKKEFYNQNKELNGVQTYLYENNSSTYHRSEYKDPDGTLLSYYKHDYDKNGNIISSRAFNGLTDEFLRIERFEYNDKNQRISRDIRNVADEVQRKFSFKMDAFNNEMSMMVQQADEKVIFNEQYKITKYNDQKQWLEKWGFINDIPNSYRERIFNPLKTQIAGNE